MFLWMLDVGSWSFTSAAAVGAVSPWGDEQRDMVFRAGIRNGESYRYAIEEVSVAEVIAHQKNELIGADRHLVSREQRRVDPSIRVRLHGFNFSGRIDRPKFNGHSTRRATARDVEDVCS